MRFKHHPIFDDSDASDWFELDDDAGSLSENCRPFKNLIEVYRDHQQYIEETTLNRIKQHLDEETLTAKPHVERNTVLFAPLADHGFQIYYQFYFLEHTDHAPTENDFWWAIIWCANVFDERFGPDRKRHWSVVHLGWSVD